MLLQEIHVTTAPKVHFIDGPASNLLSSRKGLQTLSTWGKGDTAILAVSKFDEPLVLTGGLKLVGASYLERGLSDGQKGVPILSCKGNTTSAIKIL